jgi:ubiquinone biosynthesis protein COQ4
MLDSTRLDDILEVGEITGRSSMLRALESVKSDPEGIELLQERPELNSRHINFEALQALPKDTVGQLFAAHMSKYGLDIDALNVPAPMPNDADETYILRRYRGNHDIWHTVLGLGTEGYEEVLVHAFTYGQLKFPLSTLIVFGGTLKHILLEGRWDVLRRQLAAAYEIGKNAKPLVGVYWERHWQTPIEEMRERLGLASFLT